MLKKIRPPHWSPGPQEHSASGYDLLPSAKVSLPTKKVYNSPISEPLLNQNVPPVTVVRDEH